MGLRLKFLLILIIFSVIPLLSFFLINQKLFDKLGDEIYHIAKVLILQTTAKELQESADNYTRNINRELRNIVNHMESCREEVEKIIHRSETTPSQTTTLWIQERISQQMVVCQTKMKNFRNDLVSVKFSSEDRYNPGYPVKTGPGSINSSPQNGTSSASDIITWILPETNQPDLLHKNSITVALPVHHANDSILGYIVIEFDIIELLEDIRPSSQWVQYMRSLLIRVNSPGRTRTDLPLVIGSKHPQSVGSDWKTEISPLHIDPELQDEAMALFRGQQYGKKGYVSIYYEDEVSIWTYSQTKIGLGILHILPEREVLYRIARHPIRLSRWMNLDSLLIVSVFVLFMVVIVAYRSRRMLKPFFSMVSAFERLSAGDFTTRLDFKTRDERHMVAQAFNNMALQLEDGIRMRQGLEVAREVQQNFFPVIDPTISDFDIAAKIIYCEETGGDYIDVLQGKDGSICVVVGDVTGHGVGAALLMTTVRALIRGRYEVDGDLSGVITSVNSKLTADMGDSGRFVTLFIMKINPVSRKLSWVRAGHDPAWLFSNTDNSIISLSGPGIAMGVDGDLVYSGNNRNKLESGDVILIGTDGIWETSSPDGDLFGKHRLEQIVSQNSHKTSTEISDSLITAVNHFRGNHKQEDDISIVVIKVVE